MIKLDDGVMVNGGMVVVGTKDRTMDGVIWMRDNGVMVVSGMERCRKGEWNGGGGE